MPKSLKELTQERAGLYEQNKALLKKADDEKRHLTAEESAEYDKRDKDIDALGDEVKKATDHEHRKQRLGALAEDLSRPLPRQTASSAPEDAPGGDGAAALSFDFGRAGRMELSPDDPHYRRLAPRATPEYRKRFDAYLHGGGHNSEALGLMVGDDSKGGYLAPVGMVAGLIKFLDDEVTLRRLGTVLPPTTAKNVGALSFDTDYADSDWTAEVPASDLSEDAAARFGKREMTPHLLTKLIKSSMKMVRSSVLPLESFLTGRLGYRFAITENKAFLSGSGAQRPLGAFTASDNGVSTARDTTCGASTVFTMDDLINLKGSLKYAYQQRSSWIVSRTFMTALRKLKYSTGEYQMGIGATPDTILNRPVFVDENCPATFTTGQYIAMLADWSFYWIQDGLGLEIQYLDQLFAAKNQVGWIGRKETDAMPVLAEAFARLKLA